jgi:hypothetical protein
VPLEGQLRFTNRCKVGQRKPHHVRAFTQDFCGTLRKRRRAHKLLSDSRHSSRGTTVANKTGDRPTVCSSFAETT